jgi:hypothetical protein
VSKTFASAIERREIGHNGDSGVAISRVIRPQTRLAHSHLYWNVRGWETPRVRFLLPISVRTGKLVEEPERPIETTVR